MYSVSERLLNCSVQYLSLSFGDFVNMQLAQGCVAADIFASVPHMLVDRYDCTECTECAGLARRKGLRTPVFSVKPYGYSLFFEPYSELGEASIAYFRNCVRAARVFGSETLCIYPANGIRDEEPEQLQENAAVALRYICAEAASLGMRIALGTALETDAPALRTRMELKKLLLRVGSDTLGALLDTHVAYQAGETPGHWLADLGERVFHIRLADGRNNGYRAWGEGCYPLADTLADIATSGYKGLITLYYPNGRYSNDPDRADRANRRAVELAGERL
mgnify:CR=1 FL=1